MGSPSRSIHNEALLSFLGIVVTITLVLWVCRPTLAEQGGSRRSGDFGHRGTDRVKSSASGLQTADLCMEELEKIQKESCKEVNAIGNTNQVYIKSLFPLSESLGQESKCGCFSFCIVECCCQDHILPAVNLLQRNEEEKRPQWWK